MTDIFSQDMWLKEKAKDSQWVMILSYKEIEFQHTHVSSKHKNPH